MSAHVLTPTPVSQSRIQIPAPQRGNWESTLHYIVSTFSEEDVIRLISARRADRQEREE